MPLQLYVNFPRNDLVSKLFFLFHESLPGRTLNTPSPQERTANQERTRRCPQALLATPSPAPTGCLLWLYGLPLCKVS